MLNIIYPYYTNRSLLIDQLERWDQYSGYVKSNIRIIIVDDGSPHSEAKDIIQSSKHQPNISIHLLKIHEDILWNTAGSRNLGMQYILENFGKNSTTFLSLMDAILPDETISYVLKNKNKLDFKNKIYKLNRQDIFTKKNYEPHHSLLLLTPFTFFSVGGLDEDFSGAYGYDDTLFGLAITRHTDIKFETLSHFVQQYQQSSKDKFNYEYNFMQGNNHRINVSRNAEIFYVKQNQNLDQLLSSKNLRFNWNIDTIYNEN